MRWAHLVDSRIAERVRKVAAAGLRVGDYWAVTLTPSPLFTSFFTYLYVKRNVKKTVKRGVNK
jgi:hypothetical protein